MMKRLGMTAVALTTALAAACGNNTDDIDPSTEFTLDVDVVFEGSASGHVEISGELDDCTSSVDPCIYGIQADAGATLTAVPGTDTAFAGWSGDCSGTALTAAVSGAAGATVACTATFVDASAAGPSREGILVANSYNCTPIETPAPGFDCNVASGASYNVNAPSPTLDGALQTLNEHCYGYVDVSDFSSEDHGEVTMTTSRVDVTATWSGGYYGLQGAAAEPFEDLDTLAITTAGGTVTVDAPPAITLLDDTDGLRIDTGDGAVFETLRLAAFGYTPDDASFGVLCRIGVEIDDAFVSHPSFLDGLAQVSGGAAPNVVYAGIGNDVEITGWDDEPRLGEAVKWFVLAGPTLVDMGELE